MSKFTYLLAAVAAAIVASTSAVATEASTSTEYSNHKVSHRGVGDPGVIGRIEPPCWWVGMKTPLQLMVHGTVISGYDVSIVPHVSGQRRKHTGEDKTPHVTITSTEKADSPNYLFININIDSDAQPGIYDLKFTRGKESFTVPYTLGSRNEGSASREGFTSSDAIYLIMADRFVNSTTSNDSSPLTEEKADYDSPSGRHGGDIGGIEEKLDYIRDLGMTAIWCTPLLTDNQEKASYHGYACSDYYTIDPRFGDNESYREMVSKAHEKGLKVIMDVVTNHCGTAHWWMKDLPFRDWIHLWDTYTHTNCAFAAHNDPYRADNDLFCLESGWFDTMMPDMNLDNPFLLHYFIQWAAWWTEWAGLDGFRVDTFPYNEKLPMSQWCSSVLDEYPNLNIVGEIWSTEVPQVAYWQAGNSNNDGFDSHLPTVMDFSLQDAICKSINVDTPRWDNDIIQVYYSLAKDCYIKDPFNVMIFPGNHDTQRIADVALGGLDKMKIVMTLMATLRGIPQIFAGDEILSSSEDRSADHGKLRVMFDENWENDPAKVSLHDYTAKLFNWRKESNAVRNGSTLHFVSRDNTYSYFRTAPGETVFVFINNCAEEKAIHWDTYTQITSTLKCRGRNVITSGEFNPEGYIVPAKSSLIIEFKESPENR